MHATAHSTLYADTTFVSSVAFVVSSTPPVRKCGRYGLVAVAVTESVGIQMLQLNMQDDHITVTIEKNFPDTTTDSTGNTVSYVRCAPAHGELRREGGGGCPPL